MKTRQTLMGLNSIFVTLAAITLVGCGTEVGTGLTGDVTVKSQSFSTTAAMALGNFVPALFVAPPVTDFKICVAKLKLEKEDGTSADKDGSGQVEFKVGLIDLSNGAEKKWTTTNLPTGYKLKKIKVKVEKDESVCGVNYSVKFNGFEATNSIEFKFKLATAAQVSAGSIINVALSAIVNSLRTAADVNTLSKDNLKDYVEAIEDSASKE